MKKKVQALTQKRGPGHRLTFLSAFSPSQYAPTFWTAPVISVPKITQTSQQTMMNYLIQYFTMQWN